jgi:hypothetical protein
MLKIGYHQGLHPPRQLARFSSGQCYQIGKRSMEQGRFDLWMRTRVEGDVF